MSLINDYFEKTKKHKEEFGNQTIVIMQVGAFFEVYGLKDNTNSDNISGSNIIDFARICDLNVVDKKACCGSYPVVMAGFKDHLQDKYVRKLQEAGYTIAVYEQDEQCNRFLSGVYSPGTYFSSDNDNITNNTCCIWIETKTRVIKNKNNSLQTMIYVGASIIDIYTGSTGMMEYNEMYIRNPCTFDELERFISIYNPSETILISNLTSEEVDDIVSFTNIKSKSLHFVSLYNGEKETKNVLRAINCEKQVYQLQLLNRFYRINDQASFMEIFNDNVYATQSFCYLLDFIYQHNPNLIYRIEEPVLENSSKKLILANHSLKQLNIIDDDNYKGKYSSVSKMLNECITPMGKRRFVHCFLNPITDEDYLKGEYDMIENLMLRGEEYQIVKVMLQHIKDLSKIMRQIMLQKISPKAIYQLYAGICSAKVLYQFIVSSEDNTLCNYLNTRDAIGIIIISLSSSLLLLLLLLLLLWLSSSLLSLWLLSLLF
jgi:DNA mismatch repair protein MutS